MGKDLCRKEKYYYQKISLEKLLRRIQSVVINGSVKRR